MSAIFFLSQQSTPLGETPSPLESIVAHVALFGALAVFISWGLAGAGERTPVWLVGVLAFSLTVLYGVTDEVHQAFVVGRVASEADLGLDATGALLGLAAEAAVTHLWRTTRR